MNINKYTDPLNVKMSKLGPIPDFNVWLFILLVIAGYIGYLYGQTINIHGYLEKYYGYIINNPLCTNASNLLTHPANYTAFTSTTTIGIK